MGKKKTTEESILDVIQESTSRKLKPGMQKKRVESVLAYLNKLGLTVSQIEVYANKDVLFLKRKRASKPPTIEQRSFGRKIGSVSTTSGTLSYVMYVVPTARAAKTLFKAKKEGKNAASNKWEKVKRLLLHLGDPMVDGQEMESTEDELKNYIDPSDYGRDSIQEILYDADGEAARFEIAKNTGLTFEDFDRIIKNVK